jgi:NAD(P)-dependent dehydrogenase (short-subunit alcohol dehydrogenase family)
MLIISLFSITFDVGWVRHVATNAFARSLPYTTGIIDAAMAYFTPLLAGNSYYQLTLPRSRGYLVRANDVATNKAGIGELVDGLNSSTDGSAVGVVADVTKSPEVQSMIDQTVSELGPLADMVANAGIVQVEDVLEISEEDVREMFGVNFIGVWNCYTRAAKKRIPQAPIPESNHWRGAGCNFQAFLAPAAFQRE